MTDGPAVRPPVDLLVVVVAYGAPGLLGQALAALEGQCPVMVVDNSSSAEVRAVARQHGATYVDPGANLGFAAAVNRGLSYRAPGSDVLLLNPDAVISADDVMRLRSALHDSPRAACAAPGQHAPGSEALDRVCWPLPSPAGAWLEAVGLARLGARCEFLVGSVLLLRGEALDDVGPLDEGYFLYAEEADWQLRARRRGWDIRYCPEIMAAHVGAGTSTDPIERERQFHGSQARFVRKWYGNSGWQLYRAAQVLGATGRAAVRTGEARASAARRAALYLRDPRSSSPRRGPTRTRSAPAQALGSSERRALRIVHVVCTDAFAGVERYVVSVATGLASLGCEVVVVGGDREQMPRELAAAGVVWFPGPTVAAATTRLGALGRFDIAHAHMTKAELAVAGTIPRHRAAVVVTRHFAAGRGSSAAARALGRVLARVPQAELAISDFVAANVEGGSIVVRPGVHGVDGEVAHDARVPAVLMLQRLAAEKQVEVGIEAFARSGLAVAGWRLVVVGDGPAAADLQERARELGVAKACDFTGARTDVDTLYATSSIFLATRPDEPFGIAVVEAMSWALPVVAAGSGGHLETVGTCRDAALFAPGDAAGAADLLVGLAHDPAKRAAYGDALRALQRERFDVARQVDETLGVYRELLAGRGAR